MSFVIKKVSTTKTKGTKLTGLSSDEVKLLVKSKDFLKSNLGAKSDEFKDVMNAMQKSVKGIREKMKRTDTSASNELKFTVKLAKKYAFSEPVEEDRSGAKCEKLMFKGKLVDLYPEGTLRYYKLSNPVEFKANVTGKNFAELKANISLKKDELKAQIQMYRTKQRTPIQESRTFTHQATNTTFTYQSNACNAGNQTLFEVGFIKRVINATKAKIVFVNKLPKTKEHHVGVEIEFVSKKARGDLAGMLYEAGLGEFVCLKDDGSLRAESEFKNTHELCILATEAKINEVVKRVIDVLDQAGSQVNKTCGLHVHLDMRNRDHKKVFANLVQAQDLLFAMNSKHRVEGSYSKRVSTTDFDAFMGDRGEGRSSRYFGINGAAVQKFKTIEIRIHSGSTNTMKINNWINILVAIASKKEAYKTKVETPEMLKTRFGLDEELIGYVKERIEKFKDKKTGQHVELLETA